jgi:hypothetical protein
VPETGLNSSELREQPRNDFIGKDSESSGHWALDFSTEAEVRPLWPYDFEGPQLSTCIPPPPPAALRSAFSRFRHPSRSAHRLRRATAAVGSEALRTAIRRSGFGACTIAGSNSASSRAAESAGSRGPELRAPREQARLHLRRYAALGLSSPEECRHRCPSVRSTFFTASQRGRGLGGMEHARCVVVNDYPSGNRP